MSKYELIDYDRLLTRIGIPDQQDWKCGGTAPDIWNPDGDGVGHDDLGMSTAGGLCLTSDVNVNGLLLNHRDGNGTVWVLTDIEGWWTLPPSEIPDVPKPYWDGSMLTTGRYLTRTITISGCFMPKDKSLVRYNRDLLLRVASIVRGVGLIAVCGNGTAPITSADDEYYDPFFDPSKMAIIQMNDVPLIETTKPNGFTQFSLSFKCVQPTKQSVGERSQVIPFAAGDPDDPDSPWYGTIKYRQYASFSSETPLPGEISEDDGVTRYDELKLTPTDNAEVGEATRKYSDVLLYNPTNLIEDEDSIYTDPPTGDLGDLNIVNKGNYFAFPVFVFEEMTFAPDSEPEERHLDITNATTGESMSIVKEIPHGTQLVVDTNARRVAVVNPNVDPATWSWNDRNYLSLTSDWITLAAGPNEMFVSGPVIFNGNQPTAYWRDTWIG